MSTTQITISDCYNGFIEELFTEEFQKNLAAVHSEFQLKRKTLLERRTLKSDLSHDESMGPTWVQTMSGYKNIISEEQKIICLRELSLNERNLCINGQAVCAGLLDLFTAAFHTKNRKTTLTFYVPKCESSLEAKWWNDLINSVQKLLKMEKGILNISFLFETKSETKGMDNLIDLGLPKTNIPHFSDESIWDKVI